MLVNVIRFGGVCFNIKFIMNVYGAVCAHPGQIGFKIFAALRYTLKIFNARLLCSNVSC